MIDIDWDKFMGIRPETLSLQDKEDLYDTIAGYIPNSSLSKKYMIHFIRVSQEVLKSKYEQMESMTNELDEVAKRQGIEESRKLQSYQIEIERLKQEIDWLRKSDKSRDPFRDPSMEEVMHQLEKLQLEKEELSLELGDKEKELMLEKKEVERYASLLAAAEREKQELTRELKTLQEEGTEKSLGSLSLRNSPDSIEDKTAALTLAIKQKNKHISQLLLDIETVEGENNILRRKIASIRDELAETTASMGEITEELSKLKMLNSEYEKKETELKEKVKSLLCQIEELVEERVKQDRHLDEYALEFNEKAQVWKELLDSKADEVNKLKAEIKSIHNAGNTFPESGADRSFNKIILQQNEQIHILQCELQRATQEINASSELIEQLKEKQINIISSTMPDKCTIDFYEKKIKVLEEKLMYAESDAHLKAEESSNLIVQLKNYESNVFGLSEAVAKIKKLEKVIEKKDFQSEKLVDTCNNLELKLNVLEEQNVVLRERLGVSASDEIDTSELNLRLKKNEEVVAGLRRRLELKENELINVKLRCRKIVALGEVFPLSVSDAPRGSSVKFEGQNEKDFIERKAAATDTSVLLKENEALRKGMHEILESIREQNSCGSVQVQSLCLERLLEALDSRHISGWYHPAMRLQAQLNAAEGKNDELRNQVRHLKAEEKKKAVELQNAYLKIEDLEKEVVRPRSTLPSGACTVDRTGKGEADQGTGPPTVTALEKRVIDAESKLFSLKVKYDGEVADLEKTMSSLLREREELLTKVEGLEYQLGMLSRESSSIPENKNFSALKAETIVLSRQVTYLKILESASREKFEKFKSEFILEEGKMLSDFLNVQNEKAMLVSKVEALEKDLVNSVSLDEFTRVSNELARVTDKYKNAVSQSSIVWEEEDGLVENLKAEITLLENEKSEVLNDLKGAKEKLLVAEALIKDDTVTKGNLSNEVSALSSSLASCEVRALNERQKSSHLEKVNDALKMQQQDLESRNKELLAKLVKLTEENFKFQAAERELRELYLKRFLAEDREALERRNDELEKLVVDLTGEKENIQELFEISQGQCRAFQELKTVDQILLKSQKEEIILLQSSSDDKASIARLSHQLSMARLQVSELTKKNKDLQVRITKVLAQNLNLESKVTEDRSELLNTRKKHWRHLEFLYRTIRDVRNLYGCVVPFRDLEDVYNKKVDLIKKMKMAVNERNNLKMRSQEYLIKKTELETQLESFEGLKRALQGDAKNLVSWHNRNTSLRLKEIRYRRQNELLLGEVSQLKESIEHLSDEVFALEKERLEREREWDRKQASWEDAQVEMCQLGRDVVPTGWIQHSTQGKVFCESATNTTSCPADSGDPGVPSPQNFPCPLANTVEAEGDWMNNETETEGHITCPGAEIPVEGGSHIPVFDVGVCTPRKSTLEEEQACDRVMVRAEKEALEMTVESLQTIIKQKEGTILRYRDMLKEERDEYEKAYAKFQDELKAANERYAVQSRAYNKLKNDTKIDPLYVDNVSSVVEKYVITIQELEEELRECRATLSRTKTEARSIEEEASKWRNEAADRIAVLEEAKRRMEFEHRAEMENLRKATQYREQKVEEEVKEREERGSTGMKNEVNEVAGVEEKEFRKPQTTDEGSTSAPERWPGEVESLRKELKLARGEANRLRDQMRAAEIRTQKRPRPTGSSSARSDSRLSVGDGGLTSKIRHLEELLTRSKEKEKELMELTEKKLRSAEEVARWDERKRSEHLVKSLTTKLKEKEAEMETLSRKNESFRNIVHRCERDKVVLEGQLKTLKASSAGLTSKLETMMLEKKEVEAETKALRVKLEEQRWHSSGAGAALLQEKLEVQERKLMAYEVASRGQSSAAEELEKYQATISSLEKLNLKLEGENLSLRLKLEKERAEAKTSVGRKLRSEKVKCSLCEGKAREGPQCSRARCEAANLRKDLNRLREHQRLLTEKCGDLTKRNLALEDELNSYRYQMGLMEDKDFLLEISTKGASARESYVLSQHVVQLQSQVLRKNRLLSRVKTLLMKAAAKEKALLEEVDFLRGAADAGRPLDCVQEIRMRERESLYTLNTMSNASYIKVIMGDHNINNNNNNKDESEREDKQNSRHISEILVNLNCPIRVIYDYIQKCFGIDCGLEFDLCDENGNLAFIYEKEPWAYLGNELLVTKATYFVVLFERDEENKVVNPMLFVPECFRKSTAQLSEMIMKIKKQLNPVQSGKGGRPGRNRLNSSTVLLR